jgi:uncharacterized protein YggU (UPF0235/DUF167 family)
VGWVDAANTEHQAVSTINTGRQLAVRVTAAAEGGKANEAVVRLLSRQLGIPKSAIRIVRGQTSRHKLLALDIAANELAARLSSPD